MAILEVNMSIELTESDLVVCGKIQEAKNTTIAKAKEIFRKYAAKLVQDYAKANDLPVAIAVVVRVKGRLDQGYAIPLDVFKKFKGKSLAVNLSGEARQAYAAEGWVGVKFTEAQAAAAD